MNDIKAEELLRKHLGKKNLTNEHIHIAAFMSCIDAINEALNIAFVSVPKGTVCPKCKSKYVYYWLNDQTFECDDCNEQWQTER
jgi:transposase-like protein